MALFFFFFLTVALKLRCASYTTLPNWIVWFSGFSVLTDVYTTLPSWSVWFSGFSVLTDVYTTLPSWSVWFSGFSVLTEVYSQHHTQCYNIFLFLWFSRQPPSSDTCCLCRMPVWGISDNREPYTGCFPVVEVAMLSLLWGVSLEVEMWSHVVALCVNCLRNCWAVFQSDFTFLLALCITLFLNYNHPSWYEVVCNILEILFLNLVSPICRMGMVISTV